ncbi:XkdX family protein [Anaerotignum faecicola]
MGVDAKVENVDIDATASEEAAAVERSEKFETVERYYKRNVWTKSQVSEAVGVWITEDEFYDIVGEKYVAPEKIPTDTEQMVSETKKMQLIMMEAMADQYEESLEKDLRNMDIQATIYEAILELGGTE